MDRDPIKRSAEQQARVFAALADPTRLRLLGLLLRQSGTNALCVNALARSLGVSQPAVSQHLRVLKDVGLVRGERMGFRVHYFVDPDGLKKARDLATEALSLPEEEEV